MDEIETNYQAENSHEILETEKVKGKADHLAPWQFKKGQSGNPTGRKPGKSLKEYAKEMLASMTDEERQEYLMGIDKKTIWEMSEGKPKQDTELSGKNGEAIVVQLVNYADNADNKNTPQS